MGLVLISYAWSDTVAIAAAIVLAAGVLALAGHRWKTQCKLLLDSVKSEFKCVSSELKEVKALLIISQVPLRSPPPWSTWALSAEALLNIISDIRVARRSIIVECGCGVSTTYIAHYLRSIGRGHIYSIEHDPYWADQVRQLLEENELADWADVIVAPLEECEIEGQTYLWYSQSRLSALAEVRNIDLLIIDGPPGNLGRRVRFPGLPFFWDRLSDDGRIILDDAYRPDEAAIAELWRLKYGMEPQILDCPHGCCIFDKGAGDRCNGVV